MMNRYLLLLMLLGFGLAETKAWAQDQDMALVSSSTNTTVNAQTIATNSATADAALVSSGANTMVNGQTPVTNSVATSTAPAPVVTEITSEHFFFDLTNKIAIYTGNVLVEDPKMKLRSEILTAKLPEGGGKIDHIVAETNVMIDFVDEKGEKTHAAGDKAVYSYKMVGNETNEIVTLTGHPVLERPDMTSWADIITYNRTKGTLDEEGHFKMLLNRLPSTAVTNVSKGIPVDIPVEPR